MKKAIGSVVLIAALVAGAQAITAAQKVVGGPFVVRVTGKTATVAWLVQTDEVRLQPETGVPITSPLIRVETTSFASLQPNTRYDFDVASYGPDGTGSFKTPPAGAEPFRFIVYGDNRTRHDVHRKLIAQVLQYGVPDFVLQTGDMVADGNDSSLWPIFFLVEKELLRRTAFFPALGNHERQTHYFESIFQGDPYHVSAAFFGHDHNYQHYLKNSIHYVVTGGGGAPLYDVSKPAAGITQKVASVENFVGVSVNGKTVHFEAIAIDGSKLEEFDIESPVR